MIPHLSLKLVESLIPILRGHFSSVYFLIYLVFFFHIYQVIAVCVFAVEFMFLVRKTAAVPYSVVIPVPSLVPKTVPRVKNDAVTPVRTVTARTNVASLVNHATRNAVGNVYISDALDCVDSHAIVSDVTSRVKSFFLASIPVLVFAGKYVQRSAECVIRMRSPRFSSELKTTRTQGLWNWLIVVMCLKLR